MFGFVDVEVSVFVIPDEGSGRELVKKLSTQMKSGQSVHVQTVWYDFLTVPLVFCSSLVDTIVFSS